MNSLFFIVSFQTKKKKKSPSYQDPSSWHVSSTQEQPLENCWPFKNLIITIKILESLSIKSLYTPYICAGDTIFSVSFTGFLSVSLYSKWRLLFYPKMSWDWHRHYGSSCYAALLPRQPKYRPGFKVVAGCGRG